MVKKPVVKELPGPKAREVIERNFELLAVTTGFFTILPLNCFNDSWMSMSNV